MYSAREPSLCRAEGGVVAQLVLVCANEDDHAKVLAIELG